jgi:hypothetical protein
MACPSEVNICRKRGDTYPFTCTIKDGDGNAIDITLYSFLLTVDPNPDPADALENLFQLVGTILDGPNGIVSFEPSALQADQTPDTYYYDIQMTDDAAKIRTILRGQFVISQDITK